MASNNNWQFRKVDSLTERLGIDDPASSLKFRKQPVFIEPEGSVPWSHKGMTAMGFTGGIGSMLVGAKRAGFDVLGNLEWRDYYRFMHNPGDNTFTRNYPGKKYLLISSIYFFRGVVGNIGKKAYLQIIDVSLAKEYY